MVQKEIIAAQDEVPDKAIDSSKPEQDLTITGLYKLIKHYGDKIDNINDNLAQSTHNNEILQTELTYLKQRVSTQDDVIKLLLERLESCEAQLALQQTEITEKRQDIGVVRMIKEDIILFSTGFKKPTRKHRMLL